ncbi:MAG: hypothetical protein ACHP7A_07175, partial [Caulobacterales bacterium]
AVGEAGLTEGVVAALGLPRIGQALSTDPSGRNPITIPLYRLDNLAVGGVAATGWLATGSPPMRGALATLDGIIGLDAFPGFVVTLDYAAGRFSLRRGALPPADGKTIFAYRDSIPVVPLTIEGRTLEAHLDTGNVRLALMAPESFTAGLKNHAQARAIGQAHTVNNTIDLFSVDLAGPARIGEVALTADSVGYPSVIPIANVGSPALQGLGV